MSFNDKREIIDIENWKPFYTSERQLSHILEGLSRKEAKICANLGEETILKLENDLAKLRKKKDNRFNISNEDIIQEPTESNLDDTPSPVLLCYSNGSEYKETFLKLIKNEKNLECLAKEGKLLLFFYLFYFQFPILLKILNKRLHWIRSYV